jgi:hypothetical protein
MTLNSIQILPKTEPVEWFHKYHIHCEEEKLLFSLFCDKPRQTRGIYGIPYDLKYQPHEAESEYWQGSRQTLTPEPTCVPQLLASANLPFNIVTDTTGEGTHPLMRPRLRPIFLRSPDSTRQHVPTIHLSRIQLYRAIPT